MSVYFLAFVRLNPRIRMIKSISTSLYVASWSCCASRPSSKGEESVREFVRASQSVRWGRRRLDHVWRRSIPVARNNGASLQEPKRANAFKTIPLFWRDSRKLAVPHLFAASYSSRYMHAILFTSNEYFSRLLEQRTRRSNANSSRETLLVVSWPFPTVVNFDL